MRAGPSLSRIPLSPLGPKTSACFGSRVKSASNPAGSINHIQSGNSVRSIQALNRFSTAARRGIGKIGLFPRNSSAINCTGLCKVLHKWRQARFWHSRWAMAAGGAAVGWAVPHVDQHVLANGLQSVSSPAPLPEAGRGSPIFCLLSLSPCSGERGLGRRARSVVKAAAAAMMQHEHSSARRRSRCPLA